MMRLIATLLMLLLPLSAAAEEIVLGLSQTRVRITTSFDGSELLIFGAVKRDAPAPTAPLDVIVTVAGPSEPLTIWRQERRAGIWVNADSVEVPGAPVFYSVNTTGPLDRVMTPEMDARYRISIPRAIRQSADTEGMENRDLYTDALIRQRSVSGLYQLRPGSVLLGDETLFRTEVELPSNLTGGKYRVRVFLTREGRMVTSYVTEIVVGKVGMERWLSDLARQQPWLYGLMAVMIAGIAGWAANGIFRVIKRG